MSGPAIPAPLVVVGDLLALRGPSGTVEYGLRLQRNLGRVSATITIPGPMTTVASPSATCRPGERTTAFCDDIRDDLPDPDFRDEYVRSS